MFFHMIIFLLVIAAVLSSFIVIRGRNKWERLVGFSLVTTKINMIIVVFALLVEQTFYLDISLVYIILGYISIAVIAEFMVKRKKRGS